MKHKLMTVILCSLTCVTLVNAGPATDELLQQYRQQGAGPFSATAGERLWSSRFEHADGPRECATCHSADPRQAGKHAQTGKLIEPLAPSVNPQRLTSVKTIAKWLKRNCLWTLGRECTAQERGDLLVYLEQR